MLRKNGKPVRIPQCRGKPGEEYIYLQKACSERAGNLCEYPSVGENQVRNHWGIRTGFPLFLSMPFVDTYIPHLVFPIHWGIRTDFPLFLSMPFVDIYIPHLVFPIHWDIRTGFPFFLSMPFVDIYIPHLVFPYTGVFAQISRSF